MTIKAQLLPQTPVVPGQARLIISKWQGGLEGLVFSIQRNQDRYYLQQGKDWGSNAVWFPISLTEDASGDLEGLIGADILDPMLEGSGTANYQLYLQQGTEGESDRGMVTLVDGLFGSQALGTTASTRETANIIQPSAEPTPEVAEPVVETIAEPVAEIIEEPIAEVEVVKEPVVEPIAEPEPKVKKKGINPLFIVLPILLLLAIAAGAAWILLKPTGDKAVAVNAAVDLPAVVVPQDADTSCSVAGLSTQSELSFVQNCIQQNMSSEQLLAVINGAKEAKQCGVAQRLYANRAQSGDAQIALAYAKEYDPEFYQANPCIAEPDKDTASYWYETVLAVDPDHQEAQQRLGALN